MLVEKIEGTFLGVVNDTYTGMKLDCNIGYSLNCTVKIVDEKAYNYVSASESLKDILYKFINVCFSACFREAYPNGAEYQELSTSGQKLNDIIKNKIAGILENNGIAIEELSVDNIILADNEKNMFERMRSMKPQSSEWICNCGNKNIGKFCTECGSPRGGR